MSKERKVNRKKVARALRRYRYVAYLVVGGNVLLVYLLLLFFLHDSLLAFFLALCVPVLVFGIAYGAPPSDPRIGDPGVHPIDSSRYAWLVECWRTRCLHYNATPGPVFIVTAREEDTRLWSFETSNWSAHSLRPILYVRESAIPLLCSETAEPVIEHELGHQRLVTPLMRCFLSYVSMPGTFLLSFFSAQRKLFGQKASHAAWPCWILEQLLFWCSYCAIAQYEEYAADALMAEAIGDEEWLVGTLRTWEEHAISLGGRLPSLRDTHLMVHPILARRIRAIQMLFD